jgi:hypothetical protein
MGIGFELLIQSSVDGESWIENDDQSNILSTELEVVFMIGPKSR